MDYRLSPELIARVHIYLDEWDMAQAELAEAVVINLTTLNQWLLGRRVARSQRADDAIRRLSRRAGVKFERALEPLTHTEDHIEAA